MYLDTRYISFSLYIIGCYSSIKNGLRSNKKLVICLTNIRPYRINEPYLNLRESVIETENHDALRFQAESYFIYRQMISGMIELYKSDGRYTDVPLIARDQNFHPLSAIIHDIPMNFATIRSEITLRNPIFYATVDRNIPCTRNTISPTSSASYSLMTYFIIDAH